ncbi:MAG: hypothetical protein ACXVCG_16925 [Bdellovibrionota bacterium]
MTFAKPFAAVFVLTFVLSLLSAPRAQAEATFGDAALTVGVATAAGAILGASTLPFYEDSGEHTKNIFYGAAFGAVVGVFISAYAGVQEGPNYDDARIAPVKPSAVAVNSAPEYRLHSEASSAVRAPASFASGTTIALSPVASVKF